MENLPIDTLVEIFKKASPRDLANLVTNRYFKNLLENPVFWQRLIQVSYGYPNIYPASLATYRLFYDLGQPFNLEDFHPFEEAILQKFKEIELQTGLRDTQEAIESGQSTSLLNYDYWLVMPPEELPGVFILAYTLFGAIFKLQRYLTNVLGNQANIVAGLIQHFQENYNINPSVLTTESVVQLTQRAYQDGDLYLLSEVPELRRYIDLEIFEYDPTENYSAANGILVSAFSGEPWEDLPVQYYLIQPDSPSLELITTINLDVIRNQILEARTLGQALLVANQLFYQLTGRSFLNEIYNFLRQTTNLSPDQISDRILDNFKGRRKDFDGDYRFLSFPTLTFY